MHGTMQTSGFMNTTAMPLPPTLRPGVERLFLDLETRSRVDLKKSGARRYAADASTQITTAVWRWRGVWKSACTVHPSIGTHPISSLYSDIAECAAAGGVLVAHHANFDCTVIAGPNQCPGLVVPPEQISCTMARAQSLALPGGLDELCSALNVRGKDPKGKALVQATCKPQKDGTFNEDINTFRELLAYNQQDVSCLISVDSMLPELDQKERRIFNRTWRRNDIGLPIDLALAGAIALRRAEIEAEVANELQELTGGYVSAVTQRQKIMEWSNGAMMQASGAAVREALANGTLLASQLPFQGTKKHELAEYLENPDLHPDVRRVFEILQESGGSAPKKAAALLDRHVGSWLKDATRYFGTRSGRNTSEGVNTFNIARPSGKYKPEEVIAGLKAGFRYGNVALTDALRGCIVAPVGYKIIDNDLSNAEYRIAMWLAGDIERLKLLAADNDPYMYNAVRMGWVPEEALHMDKDEAKARWPKERQNAKPVTLGGNYQLGHRTYQAHQRKEGRKLSDQQAMDDIGGYRKANPLLLQLWEDLKNAFWNCYYEPAGRYWTVAGGKAQFYKDGTTIWIILPSGRALPHYSVFVDDEGNMKFFRAKFGAMLPQKVFGGGILEILCQSITRDIVTHAEDEIEVEMLDTFEILDVYDSILAIAPADVANARAEQMRGIMSRPRAWTAGLPISCEGYVADRMRK